MAHLTSLGGKVAGSGDHNVRAIHAEVGTANAAIRQVS